MNMKPSDVDVAVRVFFWLDPPLTVARFKDFQTSDTHAKRSHDLGCFTLYVVW